MTPTNLAELEKRHSWHPFTPMQAWTAEEQEPVMIESGQGCVLRDQNGGE